MSRMLTYQQYYNMGPDEFRPGDVIQANLVMVVGYGGDYAIYVAPDESLTPHEVAASGDKLPSTRGDDVGQGLFPTATHKRHYRR